MGTLIYGRSLLTGRLDEPEIMDGGGVTSSRIQPQAWEPFDVSEGWRGRYG